MAKPDSRGATHATTAWRTRLSGAGSATATCSARSERLGTSTWDRSRACGASSPDTRRCRSPSGTRTCSGSTRVCTSTPGVTATSQSRGSMARKSRRGASSVDSLLVRTRLVQRASRARTMPTCCCQSGLRGEVVRTANCANQSRPSISSWTRWEAVAKRTERPFWQAASPRARATCVFPTPLVSGCPLHRRFATGAPKCHARPVHMVHEAVRALRRPRSGICGALDGETPGECHPRRCAPARAIMRRADVFGLRWSRVDMRGRTLRVVETKDVARPETLRPAA